MRAGRDYLTHPPRWEYARFDNDEFRRRCVKKVVDAVARWKPQDGCFFVCAPTGAGKTSAALVWHFRMRDDAIAKAQAGERASLLSFAYMTGHELANCLRRASIGDE